MDEMIEVMALKPTNLSPRLKQAFLCDPALAVQSLKGIIAEVLILVETHIPDFDTTPYCANFARIRPVWDTLPSGLSLTDMSL